MSRSIETSSASALTASALREHASALDASERDRDAYRDMLAESERRAETLLDMNRQLRAELDAERAAPPGATESDSVLRASLEDARRSTPRRRSAQLRRGEPGTNAAGGANGVGRDAPILGERPRGRSTRNATPSHGSTRTRRATGARGVASR